MDLHGFTKDIQRCVSLMLSLWLLANVHIFFHLGNTMDKGRIQYPALRHQHCAWGVHGGEEFFDLPVVPGPGQSAYPVAKNMSSGSAGTFILGGWAYHVSINVTTNISMLQKETNATLSGRQIDGNVSFTPIICHTPMQKLLSPFVKLLDLKAPHGEIVELLTLVNFKQFVQSMDCFCPVLTWSVAKNLHGTSCRQATWRYLFHVVWTQCLHQNSLFSLSAASEPWEWLWERRMLAYPKVSTTWFVVLKYFPVVFQSDTCKTGKDPKHKIAQRRVQSQTNLQNHIVCPRHTNTALTTLRTANPKTHLWSAAWWT